MHALIQDVGLGYWNTTARERTTFGSQFSPPTVGSRAQTQVIRLVRQVMLTTDPFAGLTPAIFKVF